MNEKPKKEKDFLDFLIKTKGKLLVFYNFGKFMRKIFWIYTVLKIKSFSATILFPFSVDLPLSPCVLPYSLLIAGGPGGGSPPDAGKII